jgi:hypothetical protein
MIFGNQILGSFTEHPHNGVMLKGNLYLDQIYTTTYLTNTASGHVTEEKESELEEFIEYTEIVMGTFGHRVFDSLEEKPIYKVEEDVEINDEPLLILKTTKAEAKGRRTNEGFVVYKGASVSVNPTKSCPETILNLRSKYTERVKDGVLIEDTLFTSPSAAAGFVTYASANGIIMWLDEKGRTLREIESNED